MKLRPLSPISHRAAIRFVEDPAPNPEGGDPAGGAPAAPAAGEKTLTQREVSAIAAREKSEGKKAAETAIAEQLGVSITEAAAIIKKAKDADEAVKSDAQKDRDAAAKEKQEAEAEKLSAKNEVHQARLERAFAKEGIDLDDDKKKEANSRLLRLVTVEAGADYAAVLAEVQQIKNDFPGLFTETSGGGGAPSGDPKGTPPKPNPGEDKYAAGAKRAQARLAQTAENPLTAGLKK